MGERRGPALGPRRVSAVSLVADVGGTPTSSTSARLELIDAAAGRPRPRSRRVADRDLHGHLRARGERLVRQLDSIRAQTRERLGLLHQRRRLLGRGVRGARAGRSGTTRASSSPAPSAICGFYANFERALRMVPAEAELVALCDQDDRWDPDKLEVLRRRRSTPTRRAARLQRHADRLRDGEVLSETFWSCAANGWDDIASMAIINTVTGAASLFRRELLDLALPFPPAATPSTTTTTGSRSARWPAGRSRTSTAPPTTTRATSSR